MKKLFVLGFFLASAASAQLIPIWTSWGDAWVRWDGGPTIAAGGSGYTTIQEEGVAVAEETVIDCIGATITCAAGVGKTTITVSGGAGGAPDTVDYLVGTADATLSAEIVVGTSPGGELGGTWASPTLDDGVTVSGWTSINTDTSWNAKGDLMAATANNAASAHTVGANDTILMADSGNADGWKNQAPATTEIADVAATEAAGTSDTWARGDHAHAGTGRVDPGTQGATLFEEFDAGLTSGTTTSIGSRFGFTVTNTNGAGSRPASVDGNHPGIAGFTTTTNVAGKCIMRSTNIAEITLNGGEIYEALVQVTDLSDVADPTYTIRIGLGDNSATSLGATTDAVYFEYRSTSANWIVATDSTSGGLTETDTGTAVVADTWTKLRWVANADATSIEFFVDGVSEATHTTDIPTASGEASGFIVGIDKTQGAVDAGLWVDYIYFDYGTLTR